MRFITEFELKFPYQLSVLETYKVKHQFDIGNQIGEMTDWANEHDDETDRFKLEIEAFPMDKWIEFKQKLFSLLQQGSVHFAPLNEVKVLELIKELESFGKPAGATKQQNDEKGA